MRSSSRISRTVPYDDTAALRTRRRVAREVLDARLARASALRQRVEGWITDGLMHTDHERVRLTERGFLVSDALFVELL